MARCMLRAASVCRIPVDAGEDTSGGSIDLLVWSSSSVFEMGCPDGARPRSYSGGEVAASRRMYGAREQVTFVSRKAHRVELGVTRTAEPGFSRCILVENLAETRREHKPLPSARHFLASCAKNYS